MKPFSPAKAKHIHSFVLLLYMAVLLGSVFHKHGHDYDPFARPELELPALPESHHHASTSYSACYIVAFATTSSLEFNAFKPDNLEEEQILTYAPAMQVIISFCLYTHPLRGPPTT